jgi:hypothetical protein
VQSHHLAVAALAEQRQADRRHEAERARLARSYRLARRPHRGRAARRWWLLAQRPADA